MSGEAPTRPFRPDPAAIALVAIAVVLNLLASLWMSRQVHDWLPVQASSAAPYVDDLFALEAGIGTFIFLGCACVMAWTILFNRAPKYDMDNGAPIEGNLRLEIVWTLVPLLIVMAIAVHAIQVNQVLATLEGKVRVSSGSEAVAVAGSAASDEPVGPIQVIGRQWSWEFIYPEGVHSTELHLPVDRRARLELISMDVLHGFYVPAFRLKQDLVPGSVIAYALTPTREGRYRLRDSMFSGGYFSANQTDVVVESEDAYRAWLTDALRRPLLPAANAATELWQLRQERGDRGWATVPPAPPPLVHVDADPATPHDA
jgi:cytochrome c oxidase subunit 2